MLGARARAVRFAVAELRGNVRVVARVRAMLPAEAAALARARAAAACGGMIDVGDAFEFLGDVSHGTKQGLVLLPARYDACGAEPRRRGPGGASGHVGPIPTGSSSSSSASVIGGGGSGGHRFEFDRVYAPHATQAQVFAGARAGGGWGWCAHVVLRRNAAAPGRGDGG